MRRRTFRCIGRLALVAVVTGLCGCSSAAPAALYAKSAKETLCLPAPDNEVVTDGQDSLFRRSQTPVTLESVTLENATNLSVVGPALLPYSAGSPFIGGPWPPSGPGNSFSPVLWNQKIGLHESVGPNIHSATVVFGVSVVGGAAIGRATGTRIDYLQSGKRRSVVTTTALIVVNSKSCEKYKYLVLPS